MKRPRRRRGRVGRVVVVVPSLFTLANLFFGFWSIVLAAQGDFYRASWWIVIAGVLDVLDGLSARVGRADTRFGAELDSVVDIVSFGIAPAVLMFYLFLGAQGFAWVFSYAFVVCVALRLARFNADTDEGHKRLFTGLPSPAAGMTLATYYPFTQTTFFQTQLVDLPWSQIMIFLMIGLSLAMVSNVQYARMPRIGVRSARGLLGLGVHVTILGFGVWSRDIFFFPLGLAYLSYGIVRWAVIAFLERGDDESESDHDTDESPLVLHPTTERTRRTNPSRRKS